MTPEDKAKELWAKFYNEPNNIQGEDISRWAVTSIQTAKSCALIAVDEILDAIKEFWNGPDWGLADTMGWQYWNKVKKELQKS